MRPRFGRSSSPVRHRWLRWAGPMAGRSSVSPRQAKRRWSASSMWRRSPNPVRDGGGDLSWAEDDPHVIVRPDGTFVLDNDWLLTELQGWGFPPEVIARLQHHPRRPASLRTETDPIPAAAWQSAPTTVLLGRQDEMVSAEEIHWVSRHLTDVRFVECDHFVLFRLPGAITDIVVEALDAAGSGRDIDLHFSRRCGGVARSGMKAA
jgi:hypothetical protein